MMEQARASGHMSPRLVLVAIRVRLAARQFAAARRVLEDAKREGVADAQCYLSIILACHRAGRHREAKRVFASAATDARLTSDDLRRVKVAHNRNRRHGPPESPGSHETSIAA